MIDLIDLSYYAIYEFVQMLYIRFQLIFVSFGTVCSFIFGRTLDTLQPLPAMPIKDEPIDTDDDYQMKSIDESDDMVDPTMFLERSEHEGDVPLTVSHHKICSTE